MSRGATCLLDLSLRREQDAGTKPSLILTGIVQWNNQDLELGTDKRRLGFSHEVRTSLDDMDRAASYWDPEIF